MLVWTTCGGVDDDAATQRCQDFDGLLCKLPIDEGSTSAFGGSCVVDGAA